MYTEKEGGVDSTCNRSGEHEMARYPALIDGETGAYGVTFPDLPGVVAMGATLDEALLNAEEALRDYATETEKDGRPIVAPKRARRRVACRGLHARHGSPDSSLRSQRPRQPDPR